MYHSPLRPISLLLTAASIVVAGAQSAEAQATNDSPNIIYIVGDDHGYGDLGCFGGEAITPHLDTLAAEGARLTDCYVVGPTCVPSRAGFMTMRYPSRFGFENPDLTIAAVMDEGLSQDEAILPQYLRTKGYATAQFGKWHLGFAPGSRPLDRGFDEALSVAGGLNDYFTWYNLGNLDMFLGNNPYPPQEGDYSTDVFTDFAIDFVTRHKEQPFFLYLPYTAPHWAPATSPPQQHKPPQAPQAYLDMYPGKAADRKGCLAAITAMDDAIGRLLDKLDELGLAENTLIIYFGDNGGQIKSNGGGNNDPLRNEKGTLWEGGIRVPAMVRWPAEIEAGQTCSVPMTAMDLSALALAAANVDPTEMAAGPIDGKNPIAALQGDTSDLHPYLAFRYKNQAVIRRGDYKLVGSNQSNQIGGTLYLYNLANDIGEQNNIASSNPDIVTELKNTFNLEWKPAMSNDQALP